MKNLCKCHSVRRIFRAVNSIPVKNNCEKIHYDLFKGTFQKINFQKIISDPNLNLYRPKIPFETSSRSRELFYIGRRWLLKTTNRKN